jgi:hypothetical protein
MVDLKISANLALYHSRRIPAAVSYCLFKRTQDVAALDEAIVHEHHAIEAWRQLVAEAGDVYADDLMMGTRKADLCGHWKNELAALERGLGALKEKRRTFEPTETVKPSPRYTTALAAGDHEPPLAIFQPVVTAPPGKPITITAEVSDPSGVKWVRLRYRSVNQYLDFQTLPMLPTGEKDRYQAVITAEQIAAKWDLMYLIEVMDNRGNGKIYPDLNVESPYVVVRLER